ncbi:MAG: general secretion pathway protein GspC, partial [Polyangiaceae bacterium]|nr:general secretion pathway protein GspC [Polyangiaceae bacterium]
MSLDLIIKKYFPALALVLIAVIAWFQANGVSYLVDAAVAPGSGPTFAPQMAGKTTQVPRPSVDAIHNRNPFDSTTGPLNAEEVELPVPEEEELTVDDPLSVPNCTGVTIHGVTESDDPLWSFAMISSSGEK